MDETILRVTPILNVVLYGEFHASLWVGFHYTTKLSIDIFLLHALRVTVGQLGVSSHQLEIENGHANEVPTPREERIYRLCHIEIED